VKDTRRKAMKRRHLISYSSVDRAYPRVYEPKSVAELQQLLKQAKTEKWSVTLRGGGYSFDSQSLNDDAVISLHHLHHIKSIDQKQAQITVEPAIQWGNIVRQLLPLGLTPHIVVTTGQATAGGTLSADCLSRNSARYGKDGRHVVRFQLLTMDGQLLECSPTENAELFHAVIGGFGYLGVVTEITYNLLQIGNRTQVQTVVNKYTSLESLVAGLKQHMQELQSWDAVYAVAFFSGDQDKGYVCRSRYSADRHLKRFFLYFGINPVRILFEWLSRITWIETLALNIAFRFFVRENQSYLDKFEGYTFFMESDRISKDIASRFGIQLPTIQQTFIIPEANLPAFLTTLSKMLRKKQLTPNMFDIVPIPSDDFLMSASNGLNGFAVSVAFEDLNMGNIIELLEELHALSTVCSQLGGRVHLVKNVYATPEQLHTMYGQSMETFLRLKKQIDPEGILRNSFFERVFGYDQSSIEK
jgi:decaprenylphospho-beta-D-ribofuranose 2-oxidase